MSLYDAHLLPQLIGITVTTYDGVLPSPDAASKDSSDRRIPRSPTREGLEYSAHSASVARLHDPHRTLVLQRL